MPDLQDGESTQVQGSARAPYILKNVGGVYSCTCPAWKNQSLPIERRTCKHLRAYRGERAEQERLGSLPAPSAVSTPKGKITASKLLLAQPWDNATDLTGWWMSEKLDGVRALWDGRQFLSRQGNVYHAPAWFKAGLPSVPLGGEGPCSSRPTRSAGRTPTSSWNNSAPPSSETETHTKERPNMAKRRQPSHDEFMAACNTVARQWLLNRRIVEVRYLNADECRRLTWDHTSVALVLDDETTVYAARDSEGNDAGALHGVSKSGEEFVLPELNI